MRDMIKVAVIWLVLGYLASGCGKADGMPAARVVTPCSAAVDSCVCFATTPPQCVPYDATSKVMPTPSPTPVASPVPMCGSGWDTYPCPFPSSKH